MMVLYSFSFAYALIAMFSQAATLFFRYFLCDTLFFRLTLLTKRGKLIMGFMHLFNWHQKQFSLLDVALDETAMIAFALLIAKFWPVLTSLAWYWYAIIFVICIIKPIYSWMSMY